MSKQSIPKPLIYMGQPEQKPAPPAPPARPHYVSFSEDVVLPGCGGDYDLAIATLQQCAEHLKKIRPAQKGDIVMIYEDPLTMQRAEGKAELIEEIQDNYWKVRFLSDGLVGGRMLSRGIVPA